MEEKTRPPFPKLMGTLAKKLSAQSPTPEPQPDKDPGANGNAFPDDAVLRSRILGCLLGGALGDALGYPVEFFDWNMIRAKYGPEGIRSPRLLDGKARVSDDTQMTLFTAEGIVLGYWRAEERGVGAEVEYYIYQAYLCWLQTQGHPAKSLWAPVSRLLHVPEMNERRAPGNTCLNALRSGQMGTVEAPLNHSKGCGGVMRTAPLGLVRRRWSGKSPFGPALENGAKAAAITHGHPLGWVPAGMLSDLVDRCVYAHGKPLREQVEDSLRATMEAFGRYEGSADFEALLRRAIDLACDRPGDGGAAADEAAIRSLGEGWVGEEALAIAVYAALRHEHDMERALCAAVNHGGDSDSTGAIAGNILGAQLGTEGLPAAWLPTLELTDEMEFLADALLRIVDG